MSFLSTFTCHIGHHIPLKSNNECSRGSGKGRQITSLHKYRRQFFLNSAVFGKRWRKKLKKFCCFWKNGGEEKHFFLPFTRAPSCKGKKSKLKKRSVVLQGFRTIYNSTMTCSILLKFNSLLHANKDRMQHSKMQYNLIRYYNITYIVVFITCVLRVNEDLLQYKTI